VPAARAVFDWSNTQNGKLIGSIGIISAVLQGGYVRRALTRVGELKMARRGTYSCAMGLVALALVPHFTLSRPRLAFRLLQGAAVYMAFTSATVVNSLTAHASLQCDEAPEDDGAAQRIDGGKLQRPELAKGQALGRFRSSGQLGRAIGPLLGKHAYSQMICAALIFFLRYSMCILLDLWAICDICSLRYRNDWSLSAYAKSCASNGIKNGLIKKHSSVCIIPLRLYSIKAAAHAQDNGFLFICLSLKRSSASFRNCPNYELDA
jgi:hypothetical protein